MKRLLLLSVGAAMILAGFTAVAQAEIILTHRYNFEGNANDSVGSLNGTVSTGTYAPSYDTTNYKSGSESFLTGSSGSWVNMPTNDFTSQFSIAMWIKPSSIETNPYTEVLVANSIGGSSVDGFHLFFNQWTSTGGSATHSLMLELGNGTSGWSLQSSSNVITTGSWNYVVLTADKTTHSYVLYVNGVKVANGTSTIDFSTSSTWNIGTFLNGSGSTAMKSSNIDDVQVYSGVLAAEQISYLYANAGMTVPEPATAALLGVGMMSFLAYLWRKRS